MDDKTHFYRSPIKGAVVDAGILTVYFESLSLDVSGNKGPHEWTDVIDPQPWVADLNDYTVQILRNGAILLILRSTLRITIIAAPTVKLGRKRVTELEYR